MVEPKNLKLQKDHKPLFALLLCLGIVLIATTIRGPFIIDEVNYMVTVLGLRDGKVTVPGTEGLSPSKELFSFDPESFGRIANRTPVASLAPPLYAPFALPFLFLGWRGLVSLNTISFLLTGLIVFAFARRHSTSRETPWIALALVLAGGYGIEYAQGVWPHMFSVLLVTLAVYIAGDVWDGGKPILAALCGLLMGIATGVREQNIVLAAFLGLTIFLFAGRRMLSTIWYGVGTALPLTAIAAINLARDHLWHPFPKFVAFSRQMTHAADAGSFFRPVRMFWARFVDFSAHPEITYPFQSEIYKQNPESGAYLVLGTLKKSFIQSSPWVGLALVALLFVWFSKDTFKEEVRKKLQGISLLVFPLVLVFSLSGAGRTDGLAYNQRYFLELIPIAALAVALAVDGLALSIVHLAAGVLVAGITFALTLMLPSRAWYEIALMKVPLVCSLFLVLAWFFRAHPRTRNVMPIMLGVCVGWSLLVHTFDDLPASRNRRHQNADRLVALEASVPNRSALFTYWGSRDAAGPLHLTRDVVILDAGADEGADAPRLTRELQSMGRRIFILGDFFPRSIMMNIAGDDSLATVSETPIRLLEVVRRSDSRKVNPEQQP